MDVDGKVTMTITFFSPVFPDDLSKQSQQFSYVDVKVQSADGNPHSVQVYMDISGGWFQPPPPLSLLNCPLTRS